MFLMLALFLKYLSIGDMPEEKRWKPGWAFLVISTTNHHYCDLSNCHLKHLIVRLDRFLCKSVKKLSADLLGKHKLHLNQHKIIVVTQS